MAENEQQGVSLQQVLVYVERALTSDRRLLVQLYYQFQQMAKRPGVPGAESQLGEVLCSILIGEREPDLDKLDPEAAQDIQELLARLAKID
jgi:hypothetical protein